MIAAEGIDPIDRKTGSEELSSAARSDSAVLSLSTESLALLLLNTSGAFRDDDSSGRRTIIIIDDSEEKSVDTAHCEGKCDDE